MGPPTWDPFINVQKHYGEYYPSYVGITFVVQEELCENSRGVVLEGMAMAEAPRQPHHGPTLRGDDISRPLLSSTDGGVTGRRRWNPLLAVTCALVAVLLAMVCVWIGSEDRNRSKPIVRGGGGGVDWGTSRPLQVLDKPLIILISSDGFRWGYNFKAPTPNIDRLRLNGTEAETGMIPVYPSLTFPNHYSIVTGLYPAWHGVIANSFRDPDPRSSEKFNMGSHDPKWWLGEPIWETVVNNGLQAATFFWPGSEVVKGPWNCPPNLCRQYNGSVPFEERVDAVLGFVDLPGEQRPSLVTLYFEDPDHQGHETGPDAPQITDAVVHIDAMIGRLLDGLEKRGVLQDVTLMLVGDHGMVGNCDDKMIYLEDLAPWIHIPHKWIDSYSPVLAIRPPPEVDVATVFFNLSQGLASGKVHNSEYLHLYLKEDLPARLHYSESERIQPIIGMVEEAYRVADKRGQHAQCGGSHGYDNAYLSMRTIFIAAGPQFAQGRKIPSFENIQLYEVMTNILGLKAAPNNGTSALAQSLLLPLK